MNDFCLKTESSKIYYDYYEDLIKPFWFAEKIKQTHLSQRL